MTQEIPQLNFLLAEVEKNGEICFCKSVETGDAALWLHYVLGAV